MEDERRSRLVRADGGVMSYRRHGRGAPVVCLAGGPGSDAAYLEDLGGLAEFHELIVPDARGTGGSDPPRTSAGYGFDRLADDVEVLRTHLGLDRMALLAHSAACSTALVYAARHPLRLRRLTLVAPSRTRLYDEVPDDTGAILDGRRHEPWHASATAAEKRLRTGADPEEIPSLLEALAPTGYARWTERERAHAAVMRAANWEATRAFWLSDVDAADVRARLGDVTCPVLVVTGDLDALTGVNAGQGWADCFPRAVHRTIHGASHNPWVDQPKAFVRLVLSFLADEL